MCARVCTSVYSVCAVCVCARCVCCECVHACAFVCTHNASVCARVCTHAFVCSCVCTSVYSVCMCVLCVHACAFVCVHITHPCVHAHVCACVCTVCAVCMCVHMHARGLCTCEHAVPPRECKRDLGITEQLLDAVKRVQDEWWGPRDTRQSWRDRLSTSSHPESRRRPVLGTPPTAPAAPLTTPCQGSLLSTQKQPGRPIPYEVAGESRPGVHGAHTCVHFPGQH